MDSLLIVPFQNEARMCFGVCNMEKLLELAEAKQIPFAQVRDLFWQNQDDTVRNIFLEMARRHCA